VKGRKLRIALTGPTVDRDAFGKIVEITGAKAGLDTGAEKVAAAAAWGSSRRSCIADPRWLAAPRV
jgi:beta-galactosidase